MNRELQFGVRRAVLVMVLIAWGCLPTAGLAQTYTTKFEGDENPISENGKWVNNGLDWAAIKKEGGIACGTQIGTKQGTDKYDDSYAHLTGFPPDQEAWGEVRIAKPDSTCNQEVEILLRWNDSPHSATGYECMARCLSGKGAYLEIVRWEGPLGKYTYLTGKRGPEIGLKDGDVLKASIVGDVITVSVNGVVKARAVDDTYKTGNPGIATYLECRPGTSGVGSNANYAFKNFTARAIDPKEAEAIKAEAAKTIFARTYTTSFEGDENPLSEGNQWINMGEDWKKIRKKDGLAFGTQSGTGEGNRKYDDSYAHLWEFPPDQEAWGEVRIAKPDPTCFQEVEILLRWADTPHSATGYECSGVCFSGKDSYIGIVRWNGPLGDFTPLVGKTGPEYGLKDGDVLKARVVGNVITLYVNGVETLRAVDDTHTSGNPGIGMYLECPNGNGKGTNADYGFKNFTARAIEGAKEAPAKAEAK
jgi:hypothetical protein